MAEESGGRRPGVFRAGFTPEDAILYAFGVLLVAVLAGFFWHLDAQLDRMVSPPDAFRVEAPAGEAGPPTVETRFLHAQMELNALRYRYAASVLVARAGRTNAAFLIGAALALMGTFIVVRGVRESSLKLEGSLPEQIRFKVLLTSPGVAALLLGTAIIVTTLVARERTTVEEPPLRLPGELVRATDRPSDALEATADQNQAAIDAYDRDLKRRQKTKEANP